MKVLLTGSAGFIGGAIAEQLEAQGDEVVRVDLLIPEAHAAGSPAAPGTHLVDVRDPSAVRPLLDGVDVVCHQSAMVGAGVTVADLPSYASHNDLGTAVLLAAMHDAGVHRIVAASSMVVYGEGRYVCEEHGDQAPPARSTQALESGDFENHCGVCGRPLAWGLVDEDARLDPRSSYAASKVATEHYLTAWARQSPGAAVALRYHNVYGPLMPRDTPYSGVAAMFRSAIEQGRAPDVFEDGGQMRDFVHVHDVARANLLVDPAGGRGARGDVHDLQRRLRRAGPDPPGGRAGGRGHGPRPAAGGQRALPARRRAAHRGVGRAGAGAPRVQRGDPARAGAPGVRHRPAALTGGPRRR